MINAEKYKNEILETIDEFENYGVTERNQIIMCAENGCCICQFCKDHFCDNKAKTRWLLSEYKEPIKLSRLEHGILEYLFKNKQYKFIVRERNGFIYIYKSNPKKEADSWRSLALMHELGLFNNLFQFIQWEDEEPTSIKDVLDNCEVIEDAEE